MVCENETNCSEFSLQTLTSYDCNDTVTRLWKMNACFSGVFWFCRYVPLHVLNTNYKCLIQPVFDYCDVVWDNLD